MSAERRLPVVVLSGVRATDMDLPALSIACTLPTPVVLRHELRVAEGSLRRVVSDVTGVVEDVEVALDHTCLTCALRYEILPTLARLAEDGRWASVLLSLPAAAELLPLVRAIRDAVVDGRRVSDLVEVSSVAAAFDPGRLEDDLFGDVLLEEEDPELHVDDRRAVGEVLAQQLEYADVLVSAAAPDARAAVLLDEVRRPGSTVVRDAAGLGLAELLGRPRPSDEADAFVDPRRRRPSVDVPDSTVEIRDVSSAPGSGVWTLFVDTWRPFHPERLMQEIEAIGGDGMRGRGCFWLPTRPNAVAAWDGAGGQLSIGTTGTWGTGSPRTRLLITGRGESQPEVAAAVERALMTEIELAGGLGRWSGAPDGFDSWLGDYSEVA